MGLQFWVPTRQGGVKYVTHAGVVWFRSWAHERGVKVSLTIYNHDGTKWN